MKSPEYGSTGENKNKKSLRAKAALAALAGIGVANFLTSCGLGGEEVKGAPASQTLEWTRNVPDAVKVVGERMRGEECSILQMRDNDGWIDLKVNVATKDDVGSYALGGIFHQSSPVGIEQLEGNDDIVPGSFDKQAMVERMSDSSVHITASLGPRAKYEQIDFVVTRLSSVRAEGKTWVVESAIPCGVGVNNANTHGKWTAVQLKDPSYSKKAEETSVPATWAAA